MGTYNAELYDLIRKLVSEGELDEKSTAYGIAMRVVGQGLSSLSEKQLYIYERKVESLLQRRRPVPDLAKNKAP